MLVQTKEFIELIAENADLTSVNIYNASGKLIASRHGNATDKVSFPVGKFAKGLYIVKSGNSAKRFIINV